jgi:hypothetical protein
MKAIQISEELYDKLKNCVVDPFDDTPESVISRLVEIVEKARSKWSPLDARVEDSQSAAGGTEAPHGRPPRPEHWKQQAEVVL